MTLHFNDGVSIDTSGPLRILMLTDGLYVVGRGNLVPVESQEEAEDVIAALRKTHKSNHEYIDFEEIK